MASADLRARGRKVTSGLSGPSVLRWRNTAAAARESPLRTGPLTAQEEVLGAPAVPFAEIGEPLPLGRGQHVLDLGPGPLHVLVTAGPQRLQIRIVDRGRPLGDDAQRIFSTQTRLFLDFRYATLTEGVNVTEFAFAYAGSGVFVA